MPMIVMTTNNSTRVKPCNARGLPTIGSLFIFVSPCSRDILLLAERCSAATGIRQEKDERPLRAGPGVCPESLVVRTGLRSSMLSS